MDELTRITRRLESVERLEKPVSFAAGGALAALYLWWQYTANHWIATYTWMLPFAVGLAVSYFAFAMWGAKLEQAKRALADPASAAEFPVARLVASDDIRAPVAVPAPAPRPSLPQATHDDGPRILR